MGMTISKEGSSSMTERSLVCMSPETRKILDEICDDSKLLFVLFDSSKARDVDLAMACAEIAREKNSLVMAIMELEKSVESQISYYPKRPRLLNVFHSILHVQDDFLSKPEDENSHDFSSIVNAITDISDTILIPGMIAVDFADVKAAVDTNTSGFHFISQAKGATRSLKAARRIVKKMDQARRHRPEATSCLITLSASENIGIKEVHEALGHLQETLHEDINLIMSLIVDESLGEYLRISLYIWNHDE